jgi:2-oxoglutarate dehydrogenase E2 component (dihydrolipoamide succinyltransferase)
MATNIVVPEMGESIVDARVAKWLKNEGDPVAVGEALVELETDKVDVEVSAPKGGVLAKIAHGKGDDVKIGDVLGTIEEGAKGAAKAEPAKGAAAEPPEAVKGQARAKGAEDAEGSGKGVTAVAATPSVRRAARAQRVELEDAGADGPRVTKKDVARVGAPSEPDGAAGLQTPGEPARTERGLRGPASEREQGVRGGEAPRMREDERVRMSRRRATIARRLVEAQQTAAMLTTFNEVDMSAVMALRARQKETFKEKYGIGLGIVSFFVKAAIAALREFPRLNAEIQGDEMVLKRYYDIGIAVGAAEGLVVPVLRDADKLTFAEIELRIREFAKKANDGTLTLDDLLGGTFSITNGGVFGSLMSTPILNPPQVGILGLHAIQDRPVGVGGQIVLRPMMYVALTYDHRIVDGAEAVQFLVRVKKLVEDPGVLLIEN